MPAMPIKRMFSAYLLALISGTHGRLRRQREAQELRHLRRRQHQLEDAVGRVVPAGLAVFPAAAGG
jgi:hypothetical protein